MSKRKYWIIFALCALLAVGVFWALLPLAIANSDEAKFRRWERTEQLEARAYWWLWHLPQRLAQMLHLQASVRKYSSEHEQLANALFLSGYFTNLEIKMAATPTNEVQREQVAQRLRNAFRGQPGWEFWVRSNSIIVITCRQQDASLCKQAIGN
jgi:hypothetical protein